MVVRLKSVCRKATLCLEGSTAGSRLASMTRAVFTQLLPWKKVNKSAVTDISTNGSRYKTRGNTRLWNTPWFKRKKKGQKSFFLRPEPNNHRTYDNTQIVFVTRRISPHHLNRKIYFNISTLKERLNCGSSQLFDSCFTILYIVSSHHRGIW